MSSCAIGPCDNSRECGGRGCYLCDVVAKLPQPKAFRDVQQNDRPELKDTPKTKRRKREAHL